MQCIDDDVVMLRISNSDEDKFTPPTSKARQWHPPEDEYTRPTSKACQWQPQADAVVQVDADPPPVADTFKLEDSPPPAADRVKLEDSPPPAADLIHGVSIFECPNTGWMCEVEAFSSCSSSRNPMPTAIAASPAHLDQATRASVDASSVDRSSRSTLPVKWTHVIADENERQIPTAKKGIGTPTQQQGTLKIKLMPKPTVAKTASANAAITRRLPPTPPPPPRRLPTPPPDPRQQLSQRHMDQISSRGYTSPGSFRGARGMSPLRRSNSPPDVPLRDRLTEEEATLLYTKLPENPRDTRWHFMGYFGKRKAWKDLHPLNDRFFLWCRNYLDDKERRHHARKWCALSEMPVSIDNKHEIAQCPYYDAYGY